MNYEIEQRPTYKREIRKLENSDPASAENTFNPLFSQIINNIEAVLQMAEEKLSESEFANEKEKFKNLIDSKFPKSGGTISGNLTVDGKIMFNDVVGIEKNGEDKLVLKSPVVIASQDVFVQNELQTSNFQSNNLRVSGKVDLPSRFTKKTSRISSSGWESVSGLYPKRYKLLIDGLKATDFVDITIDKNSMEIAQKAELCSTIEEADGFVYIYSKNVPTSSISITYKVVI